MWTKLALNGVLYTAELHSYSPHGDDIAIRVGVCSHASVAMCPNSIVWLRDCMIANKGPHDQNLTFFILFLFLFMGEYNLILFRDFLLVFHNEYLL